MKKKKHKRLTKLIAWIVAVLAVLLAVGPFLFPRNVEPEDIRYGLTWSTRYAEDLGLDPVEGFQMAIEDLGVDLFRIPVYWDRVESVRGEFDLAELDEIILIAEEHDVDLVMVVGRRVPRWPECFFPSWVDNLSYEDMSQAQLAFVELVVNHYKDSPALLRWQVENEPYLHAFGECPAEQQPTFLKDEVEFVHGLDPDHPIQMTASGELGFWTRVAPLADIVGVSVYRTTHTNGIGYMTYPIPPWVYRAKAWFISPTPVVVSELQAEPWFADPIETYSPQEQLDLFDADDLARHIRYVEWVGFDEVTLWGGEWWLYMQEVGHPELWEAAKQINW